MARHPQNGNEQYSDEEAQRRFLAAVKAGLNTPAQAPQEHDSEGRPGAIEEAAETGENGDLMRSLVAAFIGVLAWQSSACADSLAVYGPGNMPCTGWLSGREKTSPSS